MRPSPQTSPDHAPCLALKTVQFGVHRSVILGQWTAIFSRKTTLPHTLTQAPSLIVEDEIIPTAPLEGTPRSVRKTGSTSHFFSLAPPCSADTPRNYFFIGLEAFFFMLFMVLAFMLAFMLFGFFPIVVEWWVGDASLLLHCEEKHTHTKTPV